MSEFEQFADFARKMDKFQKAFSNSFRIPTFTFVSSEISGIATKLAANSEKFNQVFKNLSDALEQLNKSRPSNFSGLLIDQQFKIIEMSHRGVFGTIEAIPVEVIQELLSSDGNIDDLNRILLDNIDALIAQARKITTARIETAMSDDDFYLLDKSVLAMESNNYEASQALSTILWDSFLSRYAGSRNHITKIKLIAEKPDISEMENFAPLYDYGAFGPALIASKTDSKKFLYSRHATVHYASKRSINKLNAIKSLTISVGLIGRQNRIS